MEQQLNALLKLSELLALLRQRTKNERHSQMMLLLGVLLNSVILTSAYAKIEYMPSEHHDSSSGRTSDSSNSFS